MGPIGPILNPMFNGQSERDVHAAALTLFNTMMRAIEEQLGMIDDMLSHLERACHVEDTDD